MQIWREYRIDRLSECTDIQLFTGLYVCCSKFTKIHILSGLSDSDVCWRILSLCLYTFFFTEAWCPQSSPAGHLWEKHTYWTQILARSSTLIRYTAGRIKLTHQISQMSSWLVVSSVHEVKCLLKPKSNEIWTITVRNNVHTSNLEHTSKAVLNIHLQNFTMFNSASCLQYSKQGCFKYVMPDQTRMKITTHIFIFLDTRLCVSKSIKHIKWSTLLCVFPLMLPY